MSNKFKFLICLFVLSFNTLISQEKRILSGENKIYEINAYLKGYVGTNNFDSIFILNFCDSNFFNSTPQFLNSVAFLSFKSSLFAYKNFIITNDTYMVEYQGFIKNDYSFNKSINELDSETFLEFKVYSILEDSKHYFFLLWLTGRGKLRMITSSVKSAEKYIDN